jgi:hypothetical protein
MEDKDLKKLLFVLLVLCMAIPITAGASLIQFETTPPQGDPVSDYYKISDGVYFTAGTSGFFPTATMDSWSTGSTPVLTDAGGLITNPPFGHDGAGDFWIHFVTPVTNVSFDSGMWDLASTANVFLFSYNADDTSGIDPYSDPGVIGLFTNATTDVYHFDFGSNVISMMYFDSSSDDGGASITNLSFTPVPEPGTMILLGSGLMGLASYGRKWRKK